MGHQLLFPRDREGRSQVEEYLLTLARQRVAGTFVSADLLEFIGELGRSGPQGKPERIVDGTIEIYVLRYEDHVIAYANTPDMPELAPTIVLLYAFREIEWENGLKMAESIARVVYEEIG